MTIKRLVMVHPEHKEVIPLWPRTYFKTGWPK